MFKLAFTLGFQDRGKRVSGLQGTWSLKERVLADLQASTNFILCQVSYHVHAEAFVRY